MVISFQAVAQQRMTARYSVYWQIFADPPPTWPPELFELL